MKSLWYATLGILLGASLGVPANVQGMCGFKFSYFGIVLTEGLSSFRDLYLSPGNGTNAISLDVALEQKIDDQNLFIYKDPSKKIYQLRVLDQGDSDTCFFQGVRNVIYAVRMFKSSSEGDFLGQYGSMVNATTLRSDAEKSGVDLSGENDIVVDQSALIKTLAPGEPVVAWGYFNEMGIEDRAIGRRVLREQIEQIVKNVLGETSDSTAALELAKQASLFAGNCFAENDNKVSRLYSLVKKFHKAKNDVFGVAFSWNNCGIGHTSSLVVQKYSGNVSFITADSYRNEENNESMGGFYAAFSLFRDLISSVKTFREAAVRYWTVYMMNCVFELEKEIGKMGDAEGFAVVSPSCSENIVAVSGLARDLAEYYLDFFVPLQIKSCPLFEQEFKEGLSYKKMAKDAIGKFLLLTTTFPQLRSELFKKYEAVINALYKDLN